MGGWVQTEKGSQVFTCELERASQWDRAKQTIRFKSQLEPTEETVEKYIDDHGPITLYADCYRNLIWFQWGPPNNPQSTPRIRVESLGLQT